MQLGFEGRAMSSFPLSIGTALAFESLFDPRGQRYDDTRVVPERIAIQQYQEIYINVYTLFRNLMGSIDKETFNRATVAEYRDILLSEIEVIYSLMNTEGRGVCQPVFYVPSYKHLYQHSSKAVVFREDTTPAQKEVKYKMVESVKALMKLTDSIIEVDSEIRPRHRTNSLILTHMPWDLLSFKNFNKLDLLESHTGVLKNRYQWYTKFYKVPDEDLVCIPFNRRMLYIFGDRILITPMLRKLRMLVLETAKKRQWTQMTTDEKILLDLSIDIKEPYVLDTIKHL